MKIGAVVVNDDTRREVADMVRNALGHRIERKPMTFDQAFNEAAAEAMHETVEGPARTWGQRLRLFRRDRWRPTAEERWKAVEACRDLCKHDLRETGELPSEYDLRCVACHAVGAGPLTILWVAVMVAKLVYYLRQLWNRD